MRSERNYTVEEEFSDTRFDRWIGHFFSKISHNNLEKLLRKGIIRVNGDKVKSNFRLNEGDIINVPLSLDGLATDSAAEDLIPGSEEFIKKITIYKNNEVLILNKPFGLAVQGGTGIERKIDGYLR